MFCDHFFQSKNVTVMKVIISFNFFKCIWNWNLFQLHLLMLKVENIVGAVYVIVSDWKMWWVTPIKGSDFILRLQVTCLKGHLSEMELCRFRNLTLNLALTLTLTVCLYVSDKWPFGEITVRTSELSPILRPDGLAKQQITRLDISSDKNQFRKWSKNQSKTRDNCEKSEAISSEKKVWSLEIRRKSLQFCIMELPIGLNCWSLVWDKIFGLNFGLRGNSYEI